LVQISVITSKPSELKEGSIVGAGTPPHPVLMPRKGTLEEVRVSFIKIKQRFLLNGWSGTANT
jgi:hypothetical protein